MVTLRIASGAIVDLLFGWRLLKEVQMVDFDKDTTANLKKILVLAKRKATKG